ncbi:MAG: alpha-amylase family protein [Terracidiphilus sp.]
MLSRRKFLKTGFTTGAAAIPLATVLDAAQLPDQHAANVAPSIPSYQMIAMPARLAQSPVPSAPWQNRVRRVGQTNMTEHDPAVMNVEEWADYWHSCKVDVVFVSVTGILAFYPSKVPFHRHGKFLNGRDFFGECAAAAKKRGMRVVARMSPDLNWDDALEAHPEWAMRHKDGAAQFSTEEPRLFKTCMFSTYMDDYVPAVMREINSLYDVDCFYTNGWPPIGMLPECSCAVCSKLPASGTPAYWRAFNDRVLDLWKRYDAIAKEKKADSFFFANSGGNVHASVNLDQLGKTIAWFQADNQGRTYEDPAVWGCSLQGRVCSAVMDGKFAANVTAAYSTGTPGWRNLSKSPEETRMWFSETLASGMAPYNHFVGAEKGFCEDRRWQKVGEEYFDWAARHDAHLAVRRSVANIGVVMGQSTHLLYPGPATARVPTYMRETTQGMYEALLRGRYAFDYVHEDRLEPERLKKYRALLLPNIAMLSDRQCERLRAYVRSGGSLVASFETSLYDENLNPRGDFGLGDLFGVSRAGDVVGTNGNPYYARIEAPQAVHSHEILEGFSDTNWLAGAQNRMPLKPAVHPVLTVVPGFVRYPPELAYPPVSETSEPAVVLREEGASRLAWFAGDLERTYWLTGHTDLLRLIDNTIRWVTRDERMVRVAGPGFIELFCWETEPGYAVHLLNYSNANAFHGWLQNVEPLGQQHVSMKLPGGVRVKSVALLNAERDVPFHFEDSELQFTVPTVADYEVAAVTVA